jgi:cysteine desulfurase
VKPLYLDCNATTPIEPEVMEVIRLYMEDEFGNAGSRTHEYGLAASKAVGRAREQVAAVVEASDDEVVFTSGATEANNLAILGLASSMRDQGRDEIITTPIEHKAVLQPVEHLAKQGFTVKFLPVNSGGYADAATLKDLLTAKTGLVSIMHANNETGVLQPLDQIADALGSHEAYFHVDAAQGYGKELALLRNRRVDLISVSAHKIYGPKGIGALIARKRGYRRPPLQALMFGGGQERGLRAGTLPVALIAGLGKAAEIALRDHAKRARANTEIREEALRALIKIRALLHGDQGRCLPNAINFSVPGIDSEGLMVALKDLVGFSNGSACTSQNYAPSHVLEAMGLDAPDSSLGASNDPCGIHAVGSYSSASGPRRVSIKR